MSESSPPAVPASPADPAAALTAPASPLSPDQRAAILHDFEAWLASQPPEASAPPPPADPRIDLHTLLGQLLALRQEVNLQTRSVRAQQEQNNEALVQLSEALDLLRQEQDRGGSVPVLAGDEPLRPLLKTLVDLYDALSLAAREVQRVQDSLLPQLEQLASGSVDGEDSLPAPPPAPPPPVVSRWARMLGVQPVDTTPLAEYASRLREQQQRERAQRREQAQPLQAASERVRLTMTSLVTGYTMSVQRLDRALQQHGLEPIPTVGTPFDPELMEVLEAVTGTGRPSGEVLEEVRRGYRYQGRIFRFAQVRVARS